MRVKAIILFCVFLSTGLIGRQAQASTPTIEQIFHRWIQLRALNPLRGSVGVADCAEALTLTVREAVDLQPVINEVERQAFGPQFVTSEDKRTAFQKFERWDTAQALNLSCPLFKHLDHLEDSHFELARFKRNEEINTLALHVAEVRARLRELTFNDVLQGLLEREVTGPQGLRLTPDMYGDGCDRTLMRLAMEKYAFEPKPQNKVELKHLLARQKLLSLPAKIARQASSVEEIEDVFQVLQLRVARVPDPHRIDEGLLAAYRAFLGLEPSAANVSRVTRALGLNIIALPAVVEELKAYAHSRPDLQNDVTLQHLL